MEARESRKARTILTRVNDFVAEDIKQGMFVTILLAVINTKSGKIDFASAGHNPAIHYISKKRRAQFLNTPGMPVGIKADQVDFARELKSAQIAFEKNDFLLIYTDGVTEGRGRQKGAYGTDRIVEMVTEHRDKSAGELSRLIEADITRFMGKADQHDDIRTDQE
jgi:sigma-B regulation protein RsbU (phosphoserine phosphatase)